MKRFVGTREIRLAILTVVFVLGANALVGGGTVGFYVLLAVAITGGTLVLGHPEWIESHRWGRWLGPDDRV